MIGVIIFISYVVAISAGAGLGWWLKRRQILRPIAPHEFWGGGPRG
jgi:hypothetical protein